MTDREPPTTERLLDDLHEQVRREANARIMALIALNAPETETSDDE